VLLFTAEQLCPVPDCLKESPLGQVDPQGTQLSVHDYQLMQGINLTAATKEECPKGSSGTAESGKATSGVAAKTLLPAPQPLALLAGLVAIVFMAAF
jgi:hypothetical protein